MYYDNYIERYRYAYISQRAAMRIRLVNRASAQWLAYRKQWTALGIINKSIHWAFASIYHQPALGVLCTFSHGSPRSACGQGCHAPHLPSSTQERALVILLPPLVLDRLFLYSSIVLTWMYSPWNFSDSASVVGVRSSGRFAGQAGWVKTRPIWL